MKFLVVVILLQVSWIGVESFIDLQRVLRAIPAHRAPKQAYKFPPRVINSTLDVKTPLKKSDVGDKGYAVNCGPKDHNFTFAWSPKILQPSLEVRFSFSMVAGFAFSDGTGKVSVSIRGEEIGAVEQEISCSFLATYDKLLRCPIQKGTHISFEKSLVDVTTIPQDTYDIKATLTDLKTGELLICAKAHIVVQ